MSNLKQTSPKTNSKKGESHKPQSQQRPTQSSGLIDHVSGPYSDMLQLNQIGTGHIKQQAILRLQKQAGNSATVNTIRSGSPHTKEGLQREDQLMREVTPEDIDWATSSNGSIEQVQDAVTAATTRLNSDASTAIGHIRAAQAQYDRFEQMYNDAVGRFITGVESATAKEKQFRDNLKFVAKTALAIAAPTANTMYEAMDGVLGKVQGVAGLMNSLAGPRPSSGPAGGTSPGASAQRGGQLEWSELLSTALDAFENTVQNNSNLNTMSSDCITLVRFLDSVQEERYAGDTPQSSPNGTKVDSIVTNLRSILADLNSIGEGTISTPTGTLKDQIVERFGELTPRRVEQDIAIRWIAGLGDNERDQIDLADVYLAQLGVIDSGDNRLDYETGMYTDDIDERIIHWRAQWETSAMNLVGATVTWLGNPMVQPGIIERNGRCYEAKAYSGTVRDNHNGEWRVNVPGGAPPEGGGRTVHYRLFPRSQRFFRLVVELSRRSTPKSEMGSDLKWSGQRRHGWRRPTGRTGYECVVKRSSRYRLSCIGHR